LALVSIAIVLGVSFLFVSRGSPSPPPVSHAIKDRGAEETIVTEDGSVVFQGQEFPRFSPSDIGGELSAEHFIAIMENENSTQLTLQTFREAADGAAVNWRLRLDQLSASDGDEVEGRFTLPYRLVHRTRSSMHSRGSEISVTCRFSVQNLERLLALRKGDWVRVQGHISFDGHGVKINEARLAEAPKAAGENASP
jgi:hypothetical protein